MPTPVHFFLAIIHRWWPLAVPFRMDSPTWVRETKSEGTLFPLSGSFLHACLFSSLTWAGDPLSPNTTRFLRWCWWIKEKRWWIFSTLFLPRSAWHVNAFFKLKLLGWHGSQNPIVYSSVKHYLHRVPIAPGKSSFHPHTPQPFPPPPNPTTLSSGCHILLSLWQDIHFRHTHMFFG